MGSSRTVGGRTAGVTLREFGRRLAGVRPRTLAAALALLTAAMPFLSRLLVNARSGVGPALATRMDLLGAIGVAGPALAAALLAGTTAVDAERVGLAFVAVFGVLALASPVVAVPAAAAVVVGGALAVGARWRAASERRVDWRLAPAVGVLAGTALSLAAAMGLVPVAGRAVGAHFAMLGAAATPALLAPGHRDWAFGGVAAGLLVAVGVAAPFVTGAVVLIGGGVVAVSLPVMAAGLGGVVTTASAGVRTGRPLAAMGAGLLLVAGVPATIPRATAAVLGVLVLVESRGGIDP